jgi:hypothetical protein
MKIKRLLRILALILMIATASVLPVPILFYNKVKLSKYLIEQIDKKKSDTKNEDKKDISL